MKNGSDVKIDVKMLKSLQSSLSSAITNKSIAEKYLASLSIDDPNRALIQASYDDAVIAIEKLTPMVKTQLRPSIKLDPSPGFNNKKGRSHADIRFQKETRGTWI